MRFGILGHVTVVDADGVALEIGGRQPRTVLALLVMMRGRPISANALIDAVWGDHPPASAAGTLQSYVSRLRGVLEPLGANLRFDDPGYTLEVGGAEVDAVLFEALVERGRAHIALGESAAARAALVEAEALWRGPALAEVRDLEMGAGMATRLDESRVTAIEARLEADLALGRHELVIGELAALVADHPFREGLHAKLAIALYRCGRQADALRSIARAGIHLRDGLGLEPGRALRELERAMLTQDPALDLPSVTTVAASRSDGPEPVSVAHVNALTSLLGRDDAVAELLDAWADAAGGPARFGVIEGEPGIGKTHLAEAVRAAIASTGALTVWGRCDEGGAAPALWPWLVPLRTLADGLDLDPGTAMVLSTDHLPDRAVPASGAERFSLVSSLAALLDRAALERPVLVLLDDLQWADDTSLELLSFLAGREGRRWMVLVTMRELEVGRNDQLVDALAALARRTGTRRMHLRGLGADDTAAMLVAVADVDRSAAEAVHRRAEGNPFYAIELARLHVDGDQAVPASVGDVVRRRIARLPSATADLLGVAAVAGREVDVLFLSRCSEVDLGAVLDHLDPAVAHRLLVTDPHRPEVLRFNHALVREVLLDGLTALRRARLHLRVADAMESDGELGTDEIEIHAEHLWRAAPAGAGRRAADALERAAEVSTRRLAYAAAESHLRRAVQLRRTIGNAEDDLRAQLRAVERLLAVIVRTRYYQGADDELVELAQRLARQLGEHDVLRQVLYYETSALWTSTRHDEAVIATDELVALTRDDSRPGVRALGHEKRAVQHWNEGRLAQAAAEIDEASALFAGVPPSADALTGEQQMVTTMFWLMIHALRGDIAEETIFARFDSAISAAPDAAAMSAVLGFAATSAAVLGRWNDVARYCTPIDEGEAVAQFAFWHGQLRMLRAALVARDGFRDEAIAMFRDGRDRYIGVRGRSSIVSAQASLAHHLAGYGWIAEARMMAAEAREELERYGERWNEPVLLAADAAILLASGHREHADRLIADAVALAERQGSCGLAAHLASRVTTC